jgi:hypothetical protein
VEKIYLRRLPTIKKHFKTINGLQLVVLLAKIKKDVQAKAVNQGVEFKFSLKTNKGGQVVLILQL